MSNRKRKSGNEAENGIQANGSDLSQALAVVVLPPIGKVVAEKFLPMKTPLADLYDSLVEPIIGFTRKMYLNDH
uniref:Uncharacterized protein n=1 Tax=Ditylenchus dipsaci TaxID=166011 RepID=A0A915CYX3_9BILA